MKLSLLTFVLGCLTLTGCTHNIGSAMSSGTLGPNQKAVGVARGESTKNYIFGGLIQVGDDSLEAAVRNALSQSKIPAQTMIGVFSDKSCANFLVFWSCTTSVFGTAIQYTELGNLKIEEKQPEVSTASSSQCRDDESFENGRCTARIPGK